MKKIFGFSLIGKNNGRLKMVRKTTQMSTE